MWFLVTNNHQIGPSICKFWFTLFLNFCSQSLLNVLWLYSCSSCQALVLSENIKRLQLYNYDFVTFNNFNNINSNIIFSITHSDTKKMKRSWKRCLVMVFHTDLLLVPDVTSKSFAYYSFPSVNILNRKYFFCEMYSMTERNDLK